MIKLTFLGDVSLNNRYRELAKKKVNPFDEVIPFLQESDLVIGNLEAVCEGNEGENLLKSPRLQTDTNALKYLLDLNIKLVTLANNHVYDNLLDGFAKTIDFLEEKQIDYIGADLIGQTNHKCIIKEVKGEKIGFLNYIHLATNPKLPVDCRVEVNIYKRKKILEDIRKIKPKCDFLFLILHWGLDNSSYPEPRQREDAKLFTHAGVDCIIGHHSHTLQGYEKIKNSYIFYSLGNFCFAPFQNCGKTYELDKDRHTTSIILNILIKDSRIYFDPIPIFIENEFIKIGAQNIIDNLRKKSKTIKVVAKVWPLYLIYLNIFYKIYFYFWGNNRNPIRRLIQIDRRKILRLIDIFKNLSRRKKYVDNYPED
jgi:poly-gamma-glutamate synthesis protein (capsule biosynthesis protein)